MSCSTADCHCGYAKPDYLAWLCHLDPHRRSNVANIRRCFWELHQKIIFLDNNAGVAVNKQIISEIEDIFYLQGNYSSMHSLGRGINVFVNKARNKIKSLFNLSDHAPVSATLTFP